MTGMILDTPAQRQHDGAEEAELEVVPVAMRLPKRKTAQQRRKAAKIRAQVRSIARMACCGS